MNTFLFLAIRQLMRPCLDFPPPPLPPILPPTPNRRRHIPRQRRWQHERQLWRKVKSETTGYFF